jgi:hypothetical protein
VAAEALNVRIWKTGIAATDVAKAMSVKKERKDRQKKTGIAAKRHKKHKKLSAPNPRHRDYWLKDFLCDPCVLS